MGHWADTKNIMQKLGTYGTLGRYLAHWTDIWDVRQKLGTLGRNWAEIGQKSAKYRSLPYFLFLM